MARSLALCASQPRRLLRPLPRRIQALLHCLQNPFRRFYYRSIRFYNDMFPSPIMCSMGCSGCHVLETLDLKEIRDVRCFHITSSTLRSIDFSARYLGKEEFIIEDAPRLERLLLSRGGAETIRVIRAPKLKILGPLSPCISEIKIANLIFQGLIPASLKTQTHTENFGSRAF
ncbi:hypothetical protein BRADI_2g36526v3 [Brachypodium distachyon]|uniref:F-box/LRR-repeat protein 15/At3g58940/PEG3-like LRR domain-containing protein n=1 Tax=Brachypodium distachyon TaxID=15368 RepID=A0A0Q3G8B9_BRADI|nr:hypothetical protein BRADI_2g36526v3 [Brachypodium distachyon]